MFSAINWILSLKYETRSWKMVSYQNVTPGLRFPLSNALKSVSHHSPPAKTMSYVPNSDPTDIFYAKSWICVVRTRNYMNEQSFSRTIVLCKRTTAKHEGSGAWPCAGLSLLKVKESLIGIQMVQTLHTSASILHVCIHKNVLTMFQ